MSGGLRTGVSGKPLAVTTALGLIAELDATSFLEKHDSCVIVVATLDGHPDEVRRWMTDLATDPGIASLTQE